MGRERVVIIGGSVAGARVAEALRSKGFTGELVVVDPEPGEAYDRPPLSKNYLKGTWSRSQISLIPGGWESLGVDRICARAISLDTQAQEVQLSNSQSVTYDVLVLATGLTPDRLIADDGEPIGHVLGSVEDADALRAKFEAGKHLVAVGGSFISAEVVSIAAEMGLTTTILDRRNALLEKSVGPIVGQLISSQHTEQGVALQSGSLVTSIVRDEDAAVISYKDLATSEERTVRADILVAGIGSRPNTDWLEGSRIRVRDGILTDARCRVFGAKNVYALGDVSRFYDVHSASSRRVGHWTHAAEQATVVAHNILNPNDPQGYREYPYFWSDQFGKKIQVTGAFSSDSHVDVVTIDGETTRQIAIASSGEENSCEGVVTFGWPKGMVAARRLMPLDPTTEEMLEVLQETAGASR